MLQMVALILVPVIALTSMFISYLVQSVMAYQLANTASDTIYLTFNIENVVSQLQMERGLSAAYLSAEENTQVNNIYKYKHTQTHTNAHHE